MTWKEFKEAVEEKDVKDDTIIAYIDWSRYSLQSRDDERVTVDHGIDNEVRIT